MDVTRTEPGDVVALAAALGLDVPDQCLPGVIEALAVIAHHARIVEGAA